MKGRSKEDFMGQKVSPNGLRLGINKDWQSKWYANSNDVPKYLMNDVEIRKYLFSKYKYNFINKSV